MEVIWITASPRDPATGTPQTVRMAGGGPPGFPFRRAGQQYRAGLVHRPRFTAKLDFDQTGWTGGTVPTTGKLAFMPAEKALVEELAGLYWKDADILVEAGPAGGDYATVLEGTVVDAVAGRDGLLLEIADLSQALNKPLATGRFAGDGGIEGGTEAAGRVKRRSWGRVFNVEGRILDKANNIVEFGDPAHPLEEIGTLRDMGRDAAPEPGVVAWQGSIAATLAQLVASTPAEGSGVVAPSIACAKWWTQPAGPLTADLKGEIGAGYVETASEIAAALVAAAAGPAIDNVAAMTSARPEICGLHIGDANETAAAALDRLLLGVSMLWVLEPAGTIELREIAFGDPAATVRSADARRTATFAPVKTRRIGWRRAQRVHNDGEIASILLVNRGAWAEDVDYYAGENVSDAGSSWTARVNHTSASGNRPPTLPTTENAHWRLNSAAGTDGINTATIHLYQRAATSPAVPASTLTYTFATGDLAGDLGIWTRTIPAPNGHPLYVTTAAAIGAGSTDAITTGEWSAPVIEAEDWSGPIAALAAEADAIVNDDILGREEKPAIVSLFAALEASYQQLSTRANALGISYSALTGARTNLGLIKAFAIPDWADTGIDSPMTLIPSAWGIDDAVLEGMTRTADGQYRTLTDDSAAALEHGWIGPITGLANDAETTATIVIEKDGVPAATRSVALYILYFGGSGNQTVGLVFDTQSGAITSTLESPLAHAVLEQNEREWFIHVTAVVANGNTTGRAYIFPAYGNPGANLAAQGSINARSFYYGLTGSFLRQGKDAFRYVIYEYQAQLAALQKAISDTDGVTSLQVSGPAQVTVKADHTGAVLAGQLPRNVAYAASSGKATVTSSATWSVSLISGDIDASIGAATGLLELDDLVGAGARVRVKAVYQGVEQSMAIDIVRQDAPPPVSGGGGSGGTTASINSFSSIASGSYATVGTVGPVTVGSGGEVVLSAPLDVQVFSSPPEGPRAIELKWQRETSPGTWADVSGTEVESSPHAAVVNAGTEFEPFYTTAGGAVNSAATVTGLTPSSSQTFRLQARQTGSSGDTRYLAGTATATGQ